MKLLNLDKLSGREKAGLCLAVFMMAAAVFEIMLVVPYARSLRSLNGEISDLKLKLRYDKSMAAAWENVAAEYEKVKGSLGKAESDSSAIGEIKVEVEELAQKANLIVDPPVHREPRKGRNGFWREYVVEISKMEGDIQKVLTLLGEIQTSPSFLQVEKIGIIPDKSSDVVRGSVLITRVMLPPDETAEPGTAVE